MITLTEKASSHLQNVSKGKDKVKFSVEGGGCSGLNYELKFTEREPNDQDQIVYFANGEMKLVIPFSSYVYLTGTEIDYSEDLSGSKFIVKNPNAITTCGCGESFSI